MALKKLFQRHSFSDKDLNTVLRDYRKKMNEVIDYFLDTDFGNLSLYDIDKSDVLNLKWNENDSNPRDLNFKVNKGDRTINLSANLTVEGASLLNQDLTTDASVNFGGVTIADGGSLSLQEDITFTGATGVNLIKMPDNLLDALSIQEGSNKYITFNTVNDEEDILIYKSVDILHTATHADDHALEIDTDAAMLGDVKAIDLDYITGQIDTGQDEGIILINIDETIADGGDVFGLEVLSTDGSANIYGMKAGAVVNPILQDSGTFIDPTLATDNHPSNHEADMADHSLITTTNIFEANSEYIIIGANTAFQEIELIFTTVSSKDIKPTFHYSISGTDTFTEFTPVDGTDGCRHTGIIAWDASDLVGHVADDVTTKFDIKIIRTKGGSFTTPVLGYAKTATTTEYTWNKNGDISIRNLTASGYIGLSSQAELRFYDNGNYVGFEAPALGADQIWVLPAADGLANDVLGTDSNGQLIWITGTSLGNVVAAANFDVDETIIRSDGTGKGVQKTGIAIDNQSRFLGDITFVKAADKCRVYIDTYDTDPTDYSQLYFRTSDSNTKGILNKTEDGDTLGKIIFQGVDDASSWQAGARIAAVQNTASGTGEVPTDLVFETYSQTTLNTDQLILKKGGNVSISKNFILTSATSTITGGTLLNIEAGANGIISDTIMNDTTVGAANVRVNAISPGRLERSTSGKKYKDKIKDLELDSSGVHQLRPVSFNSKCEFDDKNKRFIGLIADEIEQVYPEIVDYNNNNEAESYDNQMLLTLVLAEVQALRQELDELKK